MALEYTGGAAAQSSRTLPHPSGVLPRKIEWSYASTVILYHLLALLALSPWFFSWTGVVLAIAGLYVFGTLGINLCFHRLLAHRGLVVPTWLEPVNIWGASQKTSFSPSCMVRLPFAVVMMPN